MQNSQFRIKLGIYGIGLLMMGVIGISSSLATIAANFPDVPQIMIQNLISIPCIMIIPTTLIAGRLMRDITKKRIAVCGILAFIAGGVFPSFMSSFNAILAMRGLFGVGVGICQVVSNALVAEYFHGPEREKAQGALLASAMVGAAAMVVLSGWLSEAGWELAFYVYLIGAISLFLVLFMLPAKKPEKNSPETKQKTKITAECWIWTGAMFATYISAQVYPVSLSFLLAEKQLGDAADSGLGLALFAIGGILTGLLFGRASSIFKNFTIAAGCFLLAVSNLLIAFSANMAMCHVGSFLIGMGNIIVASCIFLNAGMSVSMASAGMAVSLVACAQNFGQFGSPFVINLLAAKLNANSVNAAAFLCAAAIAAILLLLALIWACRGLKKDLPSEN